MNKSIFSRSSRPEVLCEKNAVNVLAKFREKCLYRRLSNIMGSKPASLFKKRLLHTCFLVNFLKLFGAVFFIEHLWTATFVLGKTLKNFTINYDWAKYLTTLTITEHYKWFYRKYLKFWCSYEAIWKPYLEHDATFFWKVFSVEKFP